MIQIKKKNVERDYRTDITIPCLRIDKVKEKIMKKKESEETKIVTSEKEKWLRVPKPQGEFQDLVFRKIKDSELSSLKETTSN